MKWENPRAHRGLLREYWRHWTLIVELFAQRRPARRRVDARAYATLRSGLIATCRALADAEPDTDRRSYYASLEETVQPWLSPRVLARTDHEILCTLMSRCQQVERELTGRRWLWRWSTRFSPALILAASAIVFGLAWILLEFGMPLFIALREAADTVWFTITNLSAGHVMAAIAVLIIIAAIYTASQSAR